jgi:hypothetical protein
MFGGSSKTRNRNTGKSSFADWLSDQQADDSDGDKEEGANSFTLSGLINQVSALQDNVTSQMQELSGTLPEAGPLSAAFRKRVTHSVYLLLAAVFFACMAILVGLPLILLRPSKFVICITLSTGFAAASVIVLQTPKTFIGNLKSKGITKSLPVIYLISSVIFTMFVAIFHGQYLFILAAGCIQVTSMLYYLSSFVPGGWVGLKVLLKSGYLIVRTTLAPCIFVCKKSTAAFVRNLMS